MRLPLPRMTSVPRMISISKLADFRPQQGDGFPIAASEQVERTVTQKPVSSSAPSNPTPDHPASQHVSTAPTTATAHSDTTITPDNLSSASHVEDTIHPLIPDVDLRPVKSDAGPSCSSACFDGADHSDCAFGYDHHAR